MNLILEGYKKPNDSTNVCLKANEPYCSLLGCRYF
jgi:hypothetical protein